LSQERLEKNPTRILDDKIDGIKEFVKKAPKISDFLSKEEKTQHSGLLKLLSEFKIKYEIDETLVRGLDYYTNMVFEIINKDGLALGGGGRYSKLVSEFGGEDVNCVGSAFGISRIIDELSMAIESSIDIVFAPMVNKAEVRVLNYLNKCREKGISCVAKYGFNKLTNVFKYAQNVNAKYVIIVGEKELKDNTISIKNQKTMDQKNIDFIDFINSF
jgi:histidyl-tRNA synthetase